MAVIIPEVLKPEDCATCNDVMERNQIARELLRRLQECGAPCQDLLDQVNAQDLMASQIKAHFFPNER